MSDLPHSQTLLPAEQCIEALIVAGGNTRLAAERLFGNTPNATALLTASIAQDPLAVDNLNAQLRTLTTLQAYDALHEARALMPMTLAELEPKDLANYYIKIMDHVREFTEPADAPSSPGDAIAKLLNMLPPEARRAFMTLVGDANDPTQPNRSSRALDVPSNRSDPAPFEGVGSTQGETGEPHHIVESGGTRPTNATTQPGTVGRPESQAQRGAATPLAFEDVDQPASQQPEGEAA
jgi:hypothetical protein